jgi:hypothetical protein
MPERSPDRAHALVVELRSDHAADVVFPENIRVHLVLKD